MSDFDALDQAALDGLYAGEDLPTLVLADYLEEHGDERCQRLRRRMKRYMTARDAWQETVEMCADTPQAVEYAKNKLAMLLAGMVSYLIRLIGTAPGKPLERKRVTRSGYMVVRPGESGGER